MRPLMMLPVLLQVACATGEDSAETTNSDAEAQLAAFLAEQAAVDARLATFDELDFEVFTNQEWARIGESHADDIIVHWPDGHTTEGVDTHVDDLKAMFVWAPDTRIEEHPIGIGAGNYTAVTGVLEGTFTEPMPIGDGKFIEPTGNAYKIEMTTIGLWSDEGVMIEEWLFWDNLSFYQQIGLM